MNNLRLALVCAFTFLAAPAAASGPVIPMKEITHVAPLAGTEVAVLASGARMWVADARNITFTSTEITLPTTYVFSIGTVNPNVISTTYSSAKGEHTVETDCKGLGYTDCVRRHAKQLDAFQTVFPKE